MIYSATSKTRLTPDLVEERWTSAVLGVVDTVAPELSSESCIGPCEVRSSGGLLVFARDHVDELQISQRSNNGERSTTHLVSVLLQGVFGVTVLDEPVSDLGIVP